MICDILPGAGIVFFSHDMIQNYLHKAGEREVPVTRNFVSGSERKV